MKLVVVSGLSGSGKTVALHILEDIGFYCIDNLPLKLLHTFIEEACQHPNQPDHIAVGVDARTLLKGTENIQYILEHPDIIHIPYEILYLHANTPILLKRFSETRRKHPLTDSDTVLSEAIEKEKTLLLPLEQQAKLQINTSEMSIHELRDHIQQYLQKNSKQSMYVQFLSFGFKHGLPADADLVFDVRCLDNPYWVPALRTLTGKDPEVAAFLQRQQSTTDMFNDICKFIEQSLPRFQQHNRSYMTIAIGCTGGQHRSVFMVEQLSQFFSQQRSNILTRHRELQ